MKPWIYIIILTSLAVGCTSGSETADPTTSTPPPATTDAAGESLDVATFNLLHGLNLGGEACPPETEDCSAVTRLGIAFDELEANGCPAVIGLQEVGPTQQNEIPGLLPTVCGGDYVLASDQSIELPVTQWILSALPVRQAHAEAISGVSRTVQMVSLDTEIGPVDFVTTHFAAGSVDDVACAQGACTEMCEPDELAGDCNAREVVAFVEEFGTPDAVVIVTGDLNAAADEERLETFFARGYADAWTATGNADCNAETGEGCTCCVDGDGVYDGLDDPAVTFDERIDFVLVRPSETCAATAAAATVIGGVPLDPPADNVYWPSDHAGVTATITC